MSCLFSYKYSWFLTWSILNIILNNLSYVFRRKRVNHNHHKHGGDRTKENKTKICFKGLMISFLWIIYVSFYTYYYFFNRRDHEIDEILFVLLFCLYIHQPYGSKYYYVLETCTGRRGPARPGPARPVVLNTRPSPLIWSHIFTGPGPAR